MKKTSKTFIILFIVMITIFNITVNNQTVVGTDTLSTADKISNCTCLASLNMSYNIDYTITESSSSTYSNIIDDEIFVNKNSDFAADYYGDIEDKITMIVYSNNGSDASFATTNGIKLSASSSNDNNGNELVIKLNDDNLVITSFTFTSINNIYSYLNIQTDALRNPESTTCSSSLGSSETTYTHAYIAAAECSEIRFKNISNIEIDIEDIIINTKIVSRDVTTFSYKKDSNNKNMCSMQFIGRISPELYREIGSTFGTDNVTFGLFYDNKGTFEKSDAIYCLENGIQMTSSMRMITEIPYDSLNGYNSTGCTIDNDNPIYYQWGLTLSNISFGHFTNAILSTVPYVKVKKTDSTYDVYPLIEKDHSVSSLCKVYYENGDGSRIDRITFNYLKDYWWLD